MNDAPDVYEFVFRGLLTEEALDRAGRQSAHLLGMEKAELARTLALDLLEPDFVAPASEMAIVYTAIAAFENSARELVRKVLIEQFGEDWWERGVSEKIRERAETRRDDEQKTKWHGQRGEDPITYTQLSDLANVIQNNWELFEAYVRTLGWAKAVFDTIERSRNVIMHSGTLGREDVARVGMNIRDWNTQVGT
jgi:hypothetical protein